MKRGFPIHKAYIHHDIEDREKYPCHPCTEGDNRDDPVNIVSLNP